MATLFVNLKRFDVPRESGGVSPHPDPAVWARSLIRDTAATGIFAESDGSVVFILPEAAILTARDELRNLSGAHQSKIQLGTQTVYREDVRIGGNFGAFTANLPAAAALATGCAWAMVGHSEERRDKEELVVRCAPDANRAQLRAAVDEVIGLELASALHRGLRVLFCIGETAEEHGGIGEAGEVERTMETLTRQLGAALDAAGGELSAGRIVVGYEPVWAIGPGKTPPGPSYIEEVARRARDLLEQRIGFRPQIVYGGGLKSANAAAIGALQNIDGGLVALTRFSGDIGFYPDEFAEIARLFYAARRTRGGKR